MSFYADIKNFVSARLLLTKKRNMETFSVISANRFEILFLDFKLRNTLLKPFHATCVGASPTEQFTCSPCHQKHTSARSTCICHSFDGKNGLLADRNAELNWCSCDVCQTWFHENCVSSEVSLFKLSKFLKILSENVRPTAKQR